MFDFRPLEQVGRFDSHPSMEYLRRNLMRATSMQGVSQALAAGKDVVTNILNRSGVVKASSEANFRCLDRIRELHYMDRARFVALVTMAYEVVRDNSAWMLGQKVRDGSRLGEMLKDVREKNKQQWAVVKLHLQDAMEDLHGSATSR